MPQLPKFDQDVRKSKQLQHDSSLQNIVKYQVHLHHVTSKYQQGIGDAHELHIVGKVFLPEITPRICVSNYDLKQNKLIKI